MKKYILLFSLVLCAVMACSASALDLLYGLDFNGGEDEDRLANVRHAIGKAPVLNGFREGEDCCWPMDGREAVVGIDGKGRVLKTNRGVPRIGDGRSSLGADTTTGFTIAVNVYNRNINRAYKDVIGFRIGDKDYKIEFSDGKRRGLDLYRHDHRPSPVWRLGTPAETSLRNNVWYNLMVTVKQGVLHLYVYDENGLLVCSSSLPLEVQGGLTSVVTARNCFYAHNDPEYIFLDNLAVYRGALTAEQGSKLTCLEAQKGTVPTASDLSVGTALVVGLGCLAGLLAAAIVVLLLVRRRNKATR